MEFQYCPSNYDTLNSSTDRSLCDAHRGRLAKIGEIFWDHGMQQDFAVVYLHKHFDMSPEERLVETILEHEIIIRPSRTFGDVAPYIWRLVQNDDAPVWSPVEFLVSNQWSALAFEQAARFETAVAFRRDLARFLTNAGVDQVFGVVSRHREGLLARCVVPFSQIVEQTDRQTRTLTLRAESVPTPQPDLIETVWHFPERSADGRVAVGCRNTCRGNGAHH